MKMSTESLPVGKLKEIKIEHGLRKEIMKQFSTTYPTVKAALSYKSHTPLAEKIRSYALQHGGVVVESVVQNE